MSDPFNRDGRLSASMLRQIGAEAAAARRHIIGGRDNSYTSPDGAMFTPPPIDLQAIIKVTSSTPSTITLIGGNTITGYAAKFESWDGQASTGGIDPTWTDSTASVWFRGLNGETPTALKRYLCRQIGADASGVVIWARDVPSADFGTAMNGTTTTAVTGTYASVLSITVLKSGLYFVSGMVSCNGTFTGTPTTNSEVIACLFHNSGAASNAQVLLSPQTNAGNLFYGSCSVSVIAATSVNDTFSIQVKFADGLGTNWTAANVLGSSSSANVGTFLSFIQVG